MKAALDRGKITFFLAIMVALASNQACFAQQDRSTAPSQFCNLKTDLHRGLDWVSFDENPVEIRMSRTFASGKNAERLVRIAPAYVHMLDAYPVAGPYGDERSGKYAEMPTRPGFDRGPGTAKPLGVGQMRITMAYPSGKPMIVRQRELKARQGMEPCRDLNNQSRMEQSIVTISLADDCRDRINNTRLK